MSKETRPLVPSRRRAAVICMALSMLVVLPLASLGAALAALTSAITWDTNVVTITSNKSYHPAVVFDSNNHYHALYIEDNKLIYATDASGKLETKSIADSMGGNRDPLVSLTISGNTLYTVFNRYGSDTQVYYMRGLIEGNTARWERRIQLSNSDKGGTVAVATNGDGNVYAAWVEKGQSCASYAVAVRRIGANGALSGQFNTPAKSCDLQNRPSIAVTNDGTLHITFTSGSSIYYARLVGDSWSGLRKIGSSIGSSLATDGSALYAVWGKTDISFRRSLDGGNTWSNEIFFADGSSRASYANVGWSATAKRAFVTWGDDNDKGSLNFDIWTREFSAATGETTSADQLSHDGDNSVLPTFAAGPKRAGVIYQTKKIFLWSGTLSDNPTSGATPTPTTTPIPACNGTATIEGGAKTTQKTTVSIAVTPSSGCTPAKIQYSVDTPITNDTPIRDYVASFNMDLAENTTCAPHTVYTRLYSSSQAGETFTANIIVDKSVAASVTLQNPFARGSVATTQDGGPNDGDPTYTRNGQAYLGISDASDCSGIRDFNTTSGTVQTVTAGSYSGSFTLPSGSQFTQVFVRDNANNSRIFPADNQSYTLITDRDAPTLAAGATVAGPTTTNNIIVTLNFSGVAVNDATYTKNAAGKQFWGVWVANSHDANVQDPAALKWLPVQVQNPDTAFAVKWSLFSGLTTPDRVTDKPYYVYVKFMDGAGNVTVDRLLSAPITLAAPYTQPIVNLPLTMR